MKAKLIGQQYAQAILLNPRPGVVLGKVADIFPGEDEQQLRIDGFNGRAALAEPAPPQIAGIPVAARHQRTLADQLFIELSTEEHGMQVATVEPVLLAVKRLADDIMHPRVVAADGEIDMVIQYAVKLFRRGTDNQLDMHIRKLIAKAAQHDRQRQRGFRLDGIER